MVFVRLKNSIVFPTIPEVEIPTKIVIFLADDVQASSQMIGGQDRTLGHALGSFFTDPLFVRKVYSAKSHQDLQDALNAYIGQQKVLPR